MMLMISAMAVLATYAMFAIGLIYIAVMMIKQEIKSNKLYKELGLD